LCLADQRGVSSFCIDHCLRGQATAGHGIGIFLLHDDAVLDKFGSGWRKLAAHGRRRRCGRRSRLLLRGATSRATGQKQAEHETNFPHALCFRSSAPACRWQSWLHAAAMALEPATNESKSNGDISTVTHSVGSKWSGERRFVVLSRLWARPSEG